jgi:DNA-dependent RNA polymerase auxiliary subunit epsilon
MKETTDDQQTISISEEAQQKVRTAVEKAFGSLAEHVQKIADDFAAFDKRREEMRGRMQNGIRRTKGRVV